MTGPQHYAESEALLAMAEEQRIAAVMGDPTADPAKDSPASLVASAQVHATLALAAATALSSRERDGDHDGNGMDPTDRYEWERVASVAEAGGGA